MRARPACTRTHTRARTHTQAHTHWRLGQEIEPGSGSKRSAWALGIFLPSKSMGLIKAQSEGTASTIFSRKYTDWEAGGSKEIRQWTDLSGNKAQSVQHGLPLPRRPSETWGTHCHPSLPLTAMSDPPLDQCQCQ